jgi:hypothetical protein
MIMIMRIQVLELLLLVSLYFTYESLKRLG